jgi:hypothetical protein
VFEPKQLVWVESEQEKGVRHVQRECGKIVAGRYDVTGTFRAVNMTLKDMASHDLGREARCTQALMALIDVEKV